MLLPLAVTTTVCGAVPEKLATMKVFLESDVDAERDSVGELVYLLYIFLPLFWFCLKPVLFGYFQMFVL